MLIIYHLFLFIMDEGLKDFGGFTVTSSRVPEIYAIVAAKGVANDLVTKQNISTITTAKGVANDLVTKQRCCFRFIS